MDGGTSHPNSEPATPESLNMNQVAPNKSKQHTPLIHDSVESSLSPPPSDLDHRRTHVPICQSSPNTQHQYLWPSGDRSDIPATSQDTRQTSHAGYGSQWTPLTDNPQDARWPGQADKAQSNCISEAQAVHFPQPQELLASQLYMMPHALATAGSENKLSPCLRDPVLAPTVHKGLPRKKSGYHLQRTKSKVVPTFLANPLDAPNPMQRWQESPPEDEPASMSAIMSSLESYQPEGARARTLYSFQSHDPFTGYRRAGSATSSQSSAHSASSHHSGRSVRSATSETSQKNRSGGRVRKGKSTTTQVKGRKFCCTFCCDKFKTKYDWARHEKSLHLNLESWRCAPHGSSVVSSITGRNYCAYCNMMDPTSEHLDTHNYQACLGGDRSFNRKDHLMQHLRRTHHLDTVPLIDDWKVHPPVVTSRCGFCDRRLFSWEQRIEHLSSHFRSGSTMDNWRGEHDFPPEIAALVANSMPPYYIGADSRCIVPFSATNSHARDHADQVASRAQVGGLDDQGLQIASQSFAPVHTFSEPPVGSLMEVLASQLARFTRQMIAQGVTPSDEMLQQESRRLVYGCDDSWNQTIFDNPEWLASFRSQHIGQEYPSDASQFPIDLDDLSLSNSCLPDD